MFFLGQDWTPNIFFWTMIKPDFWPTLVFSNKILLICIDHWQNLLQEKNIQKSSSTLRRTSGSSKWWTTQTSAPHPLHPSAQKQSVKSQNMSYFSKALFWRQNILALISTQARGGKIKHLLPTKLRVAPVGGEGGS